MLKFLRKKERLDWMKKFIVMEGELIVEVQSDTLADLTQAVDKDQLDILMQILGMLMLAIHGRRQEMRKLVNICIL